MEHVKPKPFALAVSEPAESLDERFERFVRTHREKAVSLAWKLTGGSQQAAEDVAQEAFLRAHRALPRFRSEARLETWFTRILIRQAHNHRRKNNRKPTEHLGASTSVQTPFPDPGLKSRVSKAMDNLSRGQREAFVLVYLEGFTVAEASAVVNRSQGTIKTHLHRALGRLRAELEDIVSPEEGTTT